MQAAAGADSGRGVDASSCSCRMRRQLKGRDRYDVAGVRHTWRK
jgi:hypothetical protein